MYAMYKTKAYICYSMFLYCLLSNLNIILNCIPDSKNVYKEKYFIESCNMYCGTF